MPDFSHQFCRQASEGRPGPRQPARRAMCIGLAIAGLGACGDNSAVQRRALEPARATVALERAAGPLSADDVMSIVPADGRAVLLPYPRSATGSIAPTARVQVGDDAPMTVPIWWLAPARAAQPESADRAGPARLHGWLGPAVTWSATMAPATTAEDRGLALVSVPPAAGVGAGEVRIDARPARLRWLAPVNGRVEATASGRASGNPSLLSALSGSTNSPWTRWRARLAAPDLEIAPPGTSDSVASRLAVQREAVWNVALHRLSRADHQTARRLVIRLAGVVDFGEGVLAPVWPGWPGPHAPDDGLGLLLADLLAEDLSDRDRAARARAWIETLPTGAAYIVDDAGLRAGADTISTVVMVNLSDAPAAASVSADSAQAPLEMLSIPPMSAARVSIPLTRDGSGPPIRTLRLRIGAWQGQLDVAAAPVAARPPGVPIGPLVLDLDMRQLAASASTGAGATLLPESGALTAGTLVRSASGSGSGWTLYLECQTGVDAVEGGVIDVHFGTVTSAAAVWRISLGGASRLERRSPLAAPAPSPGSVVQTAEVDRWSLFIPVPAEAIEPDGTLRLGLVRRHPLPGGGVERSAWPRAIEPWREEPGRVAIDLNAWDGPRQRPSDRPLTPR